MSIDLDWTALNSQLNQQIKDFLNAQISALELPEFLDDLSITSFELGQIPPNLTIRHINDPFKEFYESESLEPNDKDIQLLVEFEYKGDLTVEFQLNLLLNYPSPGFIKLPLKLKIVEVGIHSLAVISYLSQKCFVSFLCDVDDPLFNDQIMNNLMVIQNNRIDIIRKFKIESEIGEIVGDNGNVLRNIGKIEKFLGDLVRQLLRDELAWPGWICLDFEE